MMSERERKIWGKREREDEKDEEEKGEEEVDFLSGG